MTALKYEDLTEEQILYCWNGVGSDHFPINPHDLIFKEPSKRHDVLYWIGNTEEDRKRADAWFYVECLEEVEKYRPPLKWFYRLAAEVYCFFLFRLGKYSFEYGDQPARTWEELKARVDTEKPKILTTKRKWRKYGGIILGLCWVGIPLALCLYFS